MKKLCCIIAVICTTCVAHAEDWQNQCVTPKATRKNHKLVFHGTQVFESPGAKQPLLILKMNVALWAVEKRGKWLKLTGSSNSAPFQQDAELGWVLESEIQYQDLRNCNL